MKFGIDRLLEEPGLRKPLQGRRIALLAHPASVTSNLVHSMDALVELDDIDLVAAFGPQHGLRGDKQDNMMVVLALIGIIYGALVAMVQTNIKKLVAYSSVSHLGFVVLGIFTFSLRSDESFDRIYE